jgi:hypothetical protein
MKFIKNLLELLMREIRFRQNQRRLKKRLKELQKRDPFIY